MEIDKELHWQWGKDPINVLPHAGQDANAYYTRERKVLAFFYFRDQTTGRVIALIYLVL